MLPHPINGTKEWGEIKKVADKESSNYLYWLELQQSWQHSKKKRRKDDTMYVFVRYKDSCCWTSLDAILLFNQMPDENVTNWLMRRGEFLLRASLKNDVISSLIHDVKGVKEVTYSQRDNGRKKYIYLNKVYEIVLKRRTM